MENSFFNGRDVVSSAKLTGPRVYSTDLHPNNFVGGDTDAVLLRAANSLKAKILTRGLVTINGAHYLSPFAIRFFEEHGDLLEVPSLRTAFREDKIDFSSFQADYQNVYRGAGIDDARLGKHIQLLNAKVTQLLPWKLADVGERYRELVLRGLENPTSRIHTKLRQEAGLVDSDFERLIRQIREEVDVSDDLGMLTYVNSQSSPVQACLRPFLTSCYHFIGVSVVNCEAGTDLHPVAEFKAAEQVGRGTLNVDELKLDELGVFKAYFEIAMRAIDAYAIPSAFLEKISFKEASDLGQKLRNTEFANRYDAVIAKFGAGLAAKVDAEAIDRLDIAELESEVRSLNDIFEREIENDLEGRYGSLVHAKSRAQTIRATRKLGIEAVGLAAAGIFPPIAAVRATFELAGHIKDVAQSDSSAFNTGDFRKALRQAEINRSEAIQGLIKNAKIPKGAELAQSAAVMSDIFIERAQRA